MRHDIFESRKCVHIKLPKELHASLREKLFSHNVTMQDLFQDYAEYIVEDNRSEKNIQKIVSKKLKAYIENDVKKKQVKGLMMGELDSNTLYNLLEEAQKNNHEK